MNRIVREQENPVVTQIILFALLLWAGMVAGISFLEAPVKFAAPQVTLAIGLGIGRLVFGWLNKFELLFSLVVMAGLFYNRAPFRIWTPVLLLSAVLFVQTNWLLPALDARALQIIAGKIPGPSKLHFVYVTLEIFKLGLLLGTASAIFRQQFVPQSNRRVPAYN
ncbi:hypothetical protein [Adhaeribacter radiodurans]|uniref:DUF4149 domain-containing protein n=1 Tax=Adhaeribacter radiodurans TaxID=2745197 RepID=A0A7L7L1I0_9BACT|nr:hypothetical protein [Adhaeribacter radiodurans]QMU26646.1 hypothetical protein HUW48_00750 [Adhaeribacter radiodurans]